jgi:hypothetical protein
MLFVSYFISFVQLDPSSLSETENFFATSRARCRGSLSESECRDEKVGTEASGGCQSILEFLHALEKNTFMQCCDI